MDHKRQRKTGPCFSLYVVRCSNHYKAFTLYPAGHVPYGRKPIVLNVSIDNRLIRPEDDKPLQIFQGTIFDAAIDGTNKAWSKDCHSSYDTGRFNTQLNKIVLLSQLTGVLSEQPQKLKIIIADLLQVSCQKICELSGALALKGFKETSHAIIEILLEINPVSDLYERIAAIGKLLGFWPALYQCDEGNLRPSDYFQKC